MRKRVISIFAVSVLLSTMSLPYLSLFEVRSLSLDPFSASVAGIGRATRHAVGSNRFSSRFSSLEDELLSLSYIRNVSLSPNSFMSYDVVLEYSDGMILTDGKSFYFFSSEGIEPLDESDAFPLLKRYIPLFMTEEMLSYVLSYPDEPLFSSLLTLLMDISSQNGYNGNLIGRAEYFLSPARGFGELRLYGMDDSFILIVHDATSSDVILSSLEAIREIEGENPMVFDLEDNILLRRLN